MNQPSVYKWYDNIYVPCYRSKFEAILNLNEICNAIEISSRGNFIYTDKI